MFSVSRAMKCTFVPIWGERGHRPLAWVGPVQNIAPVARRHLRALDRQMILQRQDGKCNCCGECIRLYPSPDCDADHILGVAKGGQTTTENMQLLCVRGHRSKTAKEARNCVKTINLGVHLDAKELYITSSPDEHALQFPVDKRTPLEAVTRGCALSLLAFDRVDRTYIEPMEDEVDYKAMLARFAFRPASDFGRT